MVQNNIIYRKWLDSEQTFHVNLVLTYTWSQRLDTLYHHTESIAKHHHYHDKSIEDIEIDEF